MRVLLFIDYYLPGYKGGGPIRTISNMADRLGDRIQFRIVTRDRDLGDTASYPGIAGGGWRRVGKAEVLYLPPSKLSLRAMRALILSCPCDALYINSLFSPSFAVLPLLLRRLGLIPWTACIVAPRGGLAASALAIKTAKKRVFLAFAKGIGLFNGVRWQASSHYERDDVHRRVGTDTTVSIAPNLPSRDPGMQAPPERPKASGSLKAVFLSRVVKIKNLLGALETLRQVKGSVDFDIYGPLEDPAYWDDCRKAIGRLPPHIRARHCGVVPHSDVSSVLRRYDLFFLPTFGESFGHAIAEALVAGCPILISDQTPWRGLEAKGVGWDIPIADTDRFRAALQRCVDMDTKAYLGLARRAWEYGRQAAADEESVQQSLSLFLKQK